MDLKFTPDNFRSLADHVADVQMRTSAAFTLVLVKADGYAAFASRVGEKDDLKKKWNPETDLLLAVWRGQWRSDVFLLTPLDLERHWY